MALSTKRLVCDPSIGVSDLQKVLRKQIKRANDNRDLLAQLRVPKNQNWGWKTAPHVAWMGQVSEMMVDFVKVASNAVLPGSKLRLALEKLHGEKKMNFSRYSDSDWVDQCDQRIRVILSQYRTLKMKNSAYTTAMKKATAEEKAAVDLVLDHIKLENVCGDIEGELAETEETAKDALALVPWKPISSSASSAQGISSNPMDVFKRILSKKDSSPSKSSVRNSPSKVSKPFVSEPMVNVSKAKAKRPPGLFVGEICSSTDEEPTRATLSTNKVASAKKSKKGKEEKQNDGSQYGMRSSDEEILDEALATELPRHEKKRKRKKAKVGRPAASEKSLVTKKKSEKDKSVPKKQTQEKKSAEGPEGEAKIFKTSWKHRKTSAVYHRTFNRHRQLGDSPGTARSKARGAMREVASQIDSGILTEDG